MGQVVWVGRSANSDLIYAIMRQTQKKNVSKLCAENAVNLSKKYGKT